MYACISVYSTSSSVLIVTQSVITAPTLLMEVVKRDLHLEIAVNVYLAILQMRMENAKKVSDIK